jgi:hypothetical protein
MKSLEEFNLELKRANEHLDAMTSVGTANKQDCENVKIHLDNINSIVRGLVVPDVGKYNPLPPKPPKDREIHISGKSRYNTKQF